VKCCDFEKQRIETENRKVIIRYIGEEEKGKEFRNQWKKKK